MLWRSLAVASTFDKLHLEYKQSIWSRVTIISLTHFDEQCICVTAILMQSIINFFRIRCKSSREYWYLHSRVDVSRVCGNASPLLRYTKPSMLHSTHYADKFTNLSQPTQQTLYRHSRPSRNSVFTVLARSHSPRRVRHGLGL